MILQGYSNLHPVLSRLTLSCLMLPQLVLSHPTLSCLMLSRLKLSRLMKPSGCCHNIKLFGITNTVPIIALGLTKINSGLTRLTGFLLKFYLIFVR